MAQQRCCPVDGIGVSILTPSSAPLLLPDLLGLTDLKLQEEMAKGHSYGFNMGHGKIIPFEDYTKAADALMERNLPDILHNRQTEAIFIPETHLPKLPHIVDVQEYEKRKADASNQMLSQSGLKKGTDDLALAVGDLVEKELTDGLKSFYEQPMINKKVVVLQGFTLRALKGIPGIRENDIVIIDFEMKAIICIEAKATLNGQACDKAVKQTLKLKERLEAYFASELTSGEWAFVGMIYTNNVKLMKPLCPVCSRFVIQGHSQLHTKLSTIPEYLKLIRNQCNPSNPEYVSLVKVLVFVVLHQPISTYCTISRDVNIKVVGKSAKGGPTGQGDFRSIMFWTNAQANIMLTDHQFVFFTSPWSTGKTICMREKAVMWARQNPTQKLLFVITKEMMAPDGAYWPSLLQFELKDFFLQQNRLRNVEVISLTVGDIGENYLTSILEEVTTQSPGACMVDELVVPGDRFPRFAEELEQLQRHFDAKPDNAPLWIACAGIEDGKAEHFDPSYLRSIVPPAFHIPEMNMPLRNTKRTLAMAGLEENTDVKGLDDSPFSAAKTKPVYKVPEHLMTGLEGKEFLVHNNKDGNEVAGAVEAASKELLRRTGGAGFPLLCRIRETSTTTDDFKIMRSIMKGVEGAGATVLMYHSDPDTGFEFRELCASKDEMEEWLRRWRSGEEKRVLIVCAQYSRGWEASHTLVVALGADGFENLVMRTVGYCALVCDSHASKERKKNSRRRNKKKTVDCPNCGLPFSGNHLCD